jgi:hypothetical protein
MSIERYSTATLMAMQVEAEAPSQFFTNLFFGQQVFFNTQTIEWDIVRKGRKMAPFVAPTVRGRPMARDGHVTKTMKPAYVKQTTTVDLTRPLVRLPGESWGAGDLTPMQRLNRLMAEDLIAHSEHLNSRIEWMAANTILKGGYLVSGPEYPAVMVDFQADSDLFVTLAGAATWDQTTSAPLRDIERMALEVRKASYGATCNIVVMDDLAWAVFSAHADVKDKLNTENKAGYTNTSSLDMGLRNDNIGLFYRGRVDGKYDIYVYNAAYEDDNGVTQNWMPDYTVIVASSQVAGKQYFGAILDADAQYQAVKQFFKSRSQWDPSGEEVLSQSAPLVAPGRINTWGVLTVS